MFLYSVCRLTCKAILAHFCYFVKHYFIVCFIVGLLPTPTAEQIQRVCTGDIGLRWGQHRPPTE